MSQCSFCGSKEKNAAPLCQSCGALRYPVSATPLAKTRQDKLKLSAAVAVAALTPGSFVVLALVGASRLNTKLRK
ncbi:MAG: hypothetical protein KAT04_04970 [Methylococcales bacterium]|nr:hypothetical protein [Methylococcales bacterium]